jgi:trigger factor
MASRINQISPVLVELTVEIPWEKVNKELESAYVKLQRTARIRGYRPGKVPLSVVRQLLGKAVKDEVRSTLVQEGLSEAVMEHSLEPVAMPSFERPEIADGQTFSFSVKLEVRPKIPSIDLTSLEVERSVDQVTDEVVAQQIETLRRNNAELVAPDPVRPSKVGDVVIVDYKVNIDGKERPDLAVTARQLELGAHQLTEEFENGLLGVSVGDTKVISTRFPEEHPNKELRGVQAEVEVSVKQVCEKRLPELDDEFAKDLAQDSIDALRSHVRQTLEESARKRADSNVQTKLIDKLTEQNPIPLPPTLVEQQEKALFDEMVRFQQIFGPAAPAPEITDEMKASLHERAENKIRAAFLLNQIATDNKIEVTPEQYEQKLQEIAQARGVHPAKLRASYTEKMRENLLGQILEEKLMEFLMAKATIKETVSTGVSPSKEAGQ